MQQMLEPNKNGNETAGLDPSSTGYDREAGTRSMRGSARMDMERTAPMAGRQDGTRAAKMRIYREKHREAKETFARIAGVPVETEADAVDVMARALKGGTYREVAQLIFASAHFCWSCDERNAEQELAEEERYQ